MIVALRRSYPTWRAHKVRDRLLRKLPNDIRVPACSTIHAILDRHGLVTRQRRSRTKTEGTPLSQGLAPNALWCTDYKGKFMLGDKRYRYPLTVSDYASRYLLITYCGRICIFKKKINLSTSLAGQAVGIEEVDDSIWLVSFMDYDLGYFDLETRALEPLENPFGPKVLPMS